VLSQPWDRSKRAYFEMAKSFQLRLLGLVEEPVPGAVPEEQRVWVPVFLP